MLVLSRKVGEAIRVSDDIEITVLAVDNLRVRLGIRAPRHIDVRRSLPQINMIESNRQAALHHPDPAGDDEILRKAATVKSQQD